MAWQTPVFDRTAADVLAGADKCYFSAAVLNRIEGNTQYLANLFGLHLVTKEWADTDFLTPAHMQRILDNLRTVRGMYYALPGSPGIPAMPATRFDAVNAIEEIQWSIRELWHRNQKAKTYTGEIYAGETIGVI